MRQKVVIPTKESGKIVAKHVWVEADAQMKRQKQEIQRLTKQIRQRRNKKQLLRQELDDRKRQQAAKLVKTDLV